MRLLFCAGMHCCHMPLCLALPPHSRSSLPELHEAHYMLLHHMPQALHRQLYATHTLWHARAHAALCAVIQLRSHTFVAQRLRQCQPAATPQHARLAATCGLLLWPGGLGKQMACCVFQSQRLCMRNYSSTQSCCTRLPRGAACHVLRLVAQLQAHSLGTIPWPAAGM